MHVYVCVLGVGKGGGFGGLSLGCGVSGACVRVFAAAAGIQLIKSLAAGQKRDGS